MLESAIDKGSQPRKVGEKLLPKVYDGHVWNLLCSESSYDLGWPVQRGGFIEHLLCVNT